VGQPSGKTDGLQELVQTIFWATEFEITPAQPQGHARHRPGKMTLVAIWGRMLSANYHPRNPAFAAQFEVPP